MRLARFNAEGATRVGVIAGATVEELDCGWTELLAETTGGGDVSSRATGTSFPLATCELLAPLDPCSRGVFCVGLNYREHVAEVGDRLGSGRSKPPIFCKLTTSMLDPGRPLVLDPELSKEMDWEVELGVVIGKGGRRLDPERVAEHVAGYTVVVDTTARDLQREHTQWFLGKNSHACSPIGPWVTTVDELGFPPSLELTLHLNGVEKQRGRTDQMIWRIAELVAITSASIELQPGDIFATGSPPGVGFTRQPPEFLAPGDVLRAEIEGIGRLEHAVQ